MPLKSCGNGHSWTRRARRAVSNLGTPLPAEASPPLRPQVMVEEEKHCIDILTQVSAMTKALQSVASGLFDAFPGPLCRRRGQSRRPDAQEKVREAFEAIARLVRS
jgi:DNA-binding FrmR family transcriptional regulator